MMIVKQSFWVIKMVVMKNDDHQDGDDEHDKNDDFFYLLHLKVPVHLFKKDNKQYDGVSKMSIGSIE